MGLQWWSARNKAICMGIGQLCFILLSRPRIQIYDHGYDHVYDHIYDLHTGCLP